MERDMSACKHVLLECIPGCGVSTAFPVTSPVRLSVAPKGLTLVGSGRPVV